MAPEVLIKNLQKAANAARGLAIDMVSVAKSGHLGLPLGCAEIGAALFGHLLQLNPKNPRWINRDRFVLSAGHGSAFLYAWLYLSGFQLDALDRFRVAGSNLPGHPEFGVTPGVECTTGPLGQGIGNAVGLAISEKMQQARLKKIEKFLNYRVVCLCGDGCLQEGISHEACSLAGCLKLDNLIIIYDSNDITLDAELSTTQSDDTAQRFEAYGFFVQTIDGHDIAQIIEAYDFAKASGRPSLIIAKTIIGNGIKEVEGTQKAHGETGIKFAQAAKMRLGCADKTFFINEEVENFFENKRQNWQENYDRWNSAFLNWKAENIEAQELFPDDAIENHIKNFPDAHYEQVKTLFGEVSFRNSKKISTREAGGKILNALSEIDSKMITGSADLFSSAKNYLERGGDFCSSNFQGKNIAFGIREHAMGAILNGIAYDGIFKPSGSTFLVFSDYMRPAIRVAAMAKLPVVYILTHDSIAVGQDGPTHQPVEILSSLRSVPNLDVVRPCDAWECLGAYFSAFSRSGPTALILSRQDLPILLDGLKRSEDTLRGAYIVQEAAVALKLIVIATGSELSLALDAARNFSSFVRIVSMPSMEIFERQSNVYKNLILPATCQNRLAIEAGIAMPWYRYVGVDGKIISVNSFGFSAPGHEVQEHFGFSLENIASTIASLLQETSA